MSDLLFCFFTGFLVLFKLLEKRTEIESMMDIIFKGVFLKRYR